MQPKTLVFESEHEGAWTRVYADQAGILVDTDAGTLVMTDWPRWLLVNVFSMGMGDDRWLIWSRAAMALPPGDDS